jgi:hypothetical protein
MITLLLLVIALPVLLGLAAIVLRGVAEALPWVLGAGVVISALIGIGYAIEALPTTVQNFLGASAALMVIAGVFSVIILSIAGWIWHFIKKARSRRGV